MNYYRRSDLTHEVASTLARYDETVRKFVGADYRYPIRTRDWEIARVLEAVKSVPVGSSILDTGSYNTFLPLALAAQGYRPTASDLIWSRMVKSFGEPPRPRARNVTSPRNSPDFTEENRLGGLGRPVVTAFVEITKPR